MPRIDPNDPQSAMRAAEAERARLMANGWQPDLSGINEAISRLPPQIASFINDPELGPMIIGAMQGGPGAPSWTDIQFAVLMRSGMLSPSNQNGGGGGGGGISKAQLAGQFRAEIQNLAAQMGLQGDFGHLADQAAANGWSIEMLRDMLADNITMETASRAGLVKTIVDKTRATGADYFLSISDEQALGYAKRVARNELDEEAIVSDLRDQAKQRYFWLAPQIDAGSTMKQIFQPHRETIAKLLEVAPDTVDFINDGRFKPIVEATALDGTKYSLTVGDTEKHVRGLEDWKHTNNAKSQAANAVTALARTFGSMG